MGLLRFVEKEEATIRSLQEYVEQEKVISSREPLRIQGRKFIHNYEALVTEAEESHPRRVCSMLRKHLLGFGPRRCGGNLLTSCHIDEVDSFLYKAKKAVGIVKKNTPIPKKSALFRPINQELAMKYTTSKDMRTSMLSGFQLATTSGPLAEEEVLGLCIMVEAVEFVDIGGGAGDFTLEGKVLQEQQQITTPSKIKEEKEEEENGIEEEEVKVGLEDGMSLASSNSCSKSTGLSRTRGLFGGSHTPSVSVKTSPALSSHHGLFSG